MMRLSSIAGVLVFVLGAAKRGGAEERFECLAWVDHFDFAGVQRDGKYQFDTETAQGCERILDHVAECAPTAILWRNCGGATLRYRSRADSHHQDAPFDKRRLPDNRLVYGWVRYGDAEPDILRNVFSSCRRRGLTPGVHWPYEENHWGSWTLGGWNLDHPQFWCRPRGGRPWPGRCSIAYPEVVEHKLAILDELIERGLDVLFIDTWRSGGWSPADEYVPPVIESWRQTHDGVRPPVDPGDPAWCRHVAGYVTNLFRRMRKRMNASGRKIQFLVGAFNMTGTGEMPIRERALDWWKLVEEGIVDGIVVNSVPWDSKHSFESTRALYRRILSRVNGRCRVYFPVRAYDYAGRGMPSYARATALKQHRIAEKLVRSAWEEGGDGISLECVDFDNYQHETRRVLRKLLQETCRFRRSR